MAIRHITNSPGAPAVSVENSTSRVIAGKSGVDQISVVLTTNINIIHALMQAGMKDHYIKMTCADAKEWLEAALVIVNEAIQAQKHE